MRDHLLAKQAQGVEHLLVRCRTDGAQQDHLLDPERLVQFDKAGAVGGSADAELLAAIAHLARGWLTRVRPGGEALIASVIALVVRRHGGGIVIAPEETTALALLFDVPADQLTAALGCDLRVLMAVARGHQRGARRCCLFIARAAPA